MSDSPFRFDLFDVLKGVGSVVASAVIGVLVRMLFGRAMKGIDDKLDRLEASNKNQTEELKGIRADVADCRTDIAVLNRDVDHLKAPPAPAVTPR